MGKVLVAALVFLILYVLDPGVAIVTAVTFIASLAWGRILVAQCDVDSSWYRPRSVSPPPQLPVARVVRR